MARIWASGFTIGKGKLPILCSIEGCLKEATEWVDSIGFCPEHNPSSETNIRRTEDE